MTIQEVISEVTNELEKIVSAQTVIGEPIMTCGKTLIPVTKLSVGFVSGGYEGAGKPSSGSSSSSSTSGSSGSSGGSDSNTKVAYGGGGGAGAKVEPIAFIVIDGDKTEILTLNESKLEDEIAKFLNMIPGIIEKVKAAKKDKEPKSRVIEVNETC